jgi:hypothetical protein
MAKPGLLPPRAPEPAAHFNQRARVPLIVNCRKQVEQVDTPGYDPTGSCVSATVEDIIAEILHFEDGGVAADHPPPAGLTRGSTSLPARMDEEDVDGRIKSGQGGK